MNENKTLDPRLAEALKGVFDTLSDEQKQAVKSCKTLDELTALAGKLGIALPDEALSAVSAGVKYPVL